VKTKNGVVPVRGKTMATRRRKKLQEVKPTLRRHAEKLGAWLASG
jgi:hypothetical protein